MEPKSASGASFEDASDRPIGNDLELWALSV